MSSEPSSPAVAAPATWPTLSPLERRALGVLVEKAKTTPDTYPAQPQRPGDRLQPEIQPRPGLEPVRRRLVEALTALPEERGWPSRSPAAV